VRHALGPFRALRLQDVQLEPAWLTRLLAERGPRLLQLNRVVPRGVDSVGTASSDHPRRLHLNHLHFQGAGDYVVVRTIWRIKAHPTENRMRLPKSGSGLVGRSRPAMLTHRASSLAAQVERSICRYLWDADGHCPWRPGLPGRRGRGGLFERVDDDRLQHTGDVLDDQLLPNDDQTSITYPGDDFHGLAG
jgi:hypothetical protein